MPDTGGDDVKEKRWEVMVLLTALALLELAVRLNRYQGYSNLLMNNRAEKAKSTIYTSAWGEVQRSTVQCIFESADCKSPFTGFLRCRPFMYCTITCWQPAVDL